MLLIILCLLLLAFFTGAEIAFLSANKLGIEVEKNKGTRIAKILTRFYDKPHMFLGSLLVGSNIALVVIAVLMTRFLHPLLGEVVGNSWLLMFLDVVVITAVVLFIGEFIPKVLCRHFANTVMHVFAYPLLFFQWLLAIPTWLITKMSNFSLRYVLQQGGNASEDVITRLDLQDYVEGTADTEESEIETDMFKNALHLKEVRVETCMVPRPEIVHLDINAPIEDLISLFQTTHHSRILVIDGDLDHVLGYVHHQQVLSPITSLRDSLFEIPFVPETMTAKDLMLQLIREENSIACVVDEYGGTAGIITLEDILEEIFGEIEDEHDEEEFTEQKLGDNEYLFSGRLQIEHLNHKYPELRLPEGDYNTLSGYLVMTSGTIPEEGDTITLGSYKFLCEEVTDKKIIRIRVFRLESER